MMNIHIIMNVFQSMKPYTTHSSSSKSASWRMITTTATTTATTTGPTITVTSPCVPQQPRRGCSSDPYECDVGFSNWLLGCNVCSWHHIGPGEEGKGTGMHHIDISTHFSNMSTILVKWHFPIILLLPFRFSPKTLFISIQILSFVKNDPTFSNKNMLSRVPGESCLTCPCQT